MHRSHGGMVKTATGQNGDKPYNGYRSKQ